MPFMSSLKESFCLDFQFVFVDYNSLLKESKIFDIQVKAQLALQ